MKRNRIYRSYKPWIWYVLPAPVLLWCSRRWMGGNHVWWQEIKGNKVVAELRYRKI